MALKLASFPERPDVQVPLDWVGVARLRFCLRELFPQWNMRDLTASITGPATISVQLAPSPPLVQRNVYICVSSQQWASTSTPNVERPAREKHSWPWVFSFEAKNSTSARQNMLSIISPFSLGYPLPWQHVCVAVEMDRIARIHRRCWCAHINRLIASARTGQEQKLPWLLTYDNTVLLSVHMRTCLWWTWV